ncbi:MAG: single-stranded-DNA-specific exonuclease RecJ [Myxococcota bacterium]
MRYFPRVTTVIHSPVLSLTGARWASIDASSALPDDEVRALANQLGLSLPAARVLALRLGDATERAADWLKPSLDHFHNPWAMLNMERAVERLRRALFDRQRIRVVTDYDVDGTTSSLILQAVIKLMGPDVVLDYHIPNRFGEGYGFSVAAAKKAAEDGVDLIVTADIGVRDHAAIAEAGNAGIEVLVCDHHLPKGAAVPEGATVLCPPQEGCAYPNGALAACGVSFKVAEALLGEHPKRDAILRSMLKLAAIGTVADMVPLDTLENRAIVTLGLEALNVDHHHAGLAELIGVADLSNREIRPTDLGFRLGPRINAAGRIADANLVVELLTTRDVDEAKRLARKLDGLNAERKDIQRRLVEEALEELGDSPPAFVVLSGREEHGWHRGVVGIVAARVKDEVHRPTAIVSIQGDLAVGSVRSVPEVHAVRALDQASDLLLKYGGHPAAAGFTVRTDDLPEFEQRLITYVEGALGNHELRPEHEYDAILSIDDISQGLTNELRQLGPFGMKNREPVFLIEAVRPYDFEVKGKQENILKFKVRAGEGPAIEAIWWDQAERIDTLRDQIVDLLAHVEENVWRGVRRLQLRIVDARRID